MFKYIHLHSDKSPKHTLDNSYDSCDDFASAGILLNSKVCLVDFDGDNASETKIIAYLKKTYPTTVIETTKGVHMYYRLPEVNKIKISNVADRVTVGGFQVDYKTGPKSYGIIKLNGEVRVGFSKLDFAKLPFLPSILYPLSKGKNITNIDNGEGRNNALYEHLNYVAELYRDTKLLDLAQEINKVVFLTPLPEKELRGTVASVIKRQKEKHGDYNGKADNMFEFSDFLVNQLDSHLYYSQLYIKHEHGYSKDRILIQKYSSKFLRLRRNMFTELLHQMNVNSQIVDTRSEFRVILKNGSILGSEVISATRGFSPFTMAVEYNSEAYDPNVDKFLNFIANDSKELRGVFEEILGHVLMVNRFPHRIFFLTGLGNNGKSTFLEMVNQFVGPLASHVDVSSFDDGTSLVSIIGKLVNIADDVDAMYLERSKNLKTMSSGNTVGARAIYSEPVDIKNTATLLFTSNEPPIFKDKSKGITRRLMIIPFVNTVKNRMSDLDELLSTDRAKSYILNLALSGVDRIIKRGYEMGTCPEIEQATKDYHINSDSVYNFVVNVGEINMNPLASVYEAYSDYCTTNHLGPVSRNNFVKRLVTLKYRVIKGKALGKEMDIVERIL